MPLYAFVDESARPGRYLMCAVLVEGDRAGAMRRKMRSLLLPGQRRLHFQKESQRRRRELLSQLVGIDATVVVFDRRRRAGESEPVARSLCLSAIVEHLQGLDRDISLFIERREGRDSHDHQTMDRARRPGDVLTYQHLEPVADPLLWLPDCYVWAVGAGGDWLRRVQPAIASIVEVT